MPWAHDEPVPLPEIVERLRGFRARFDRRDDYIYGLLAPGEAEGVGGAGLHARHGGVALEIGEWGGRGRTRAPGAPRWRSATGCEPTCSAAAWSPRPPPPSPARRSTSAAW